MALCLSSPGGCLFDEEDEVAVLESTAAEHGGLARPRLPEISVISPGLDTRPAVTELVRFYRSVLRVGAQLFTLSCLFFSHFLKCYMHT